MNKELELLTSVLMLFPHLLFRAIRRYKNKITFINNSIKAFSLYINIESIFKIQLKEHDMLWPTLGIPVFSSVSI